MCCRPCHFFWIGVGQMPNNFHCYNNGNDNNECNHSNSNCCCHCN